MEEVTDIMKDFDEPGHLAPNGVHVAGTKYMVIQGEPGAVIRGKKVCSILFLSIPIYMSLLSLSIRRAHNVQNLNT